jgi:hypothetical protein
MNDRVLRSNPDKSTLLSPSTASEPIQESPTTMEHNSVTSTTSITTDLQMVIHTLNKMQLDASNVFQELKEELTNRVDQVGMKVEHLAARIVQGESHRAQEMKNIQEQIDSIKLANFTSLLVTDQSSASGNSHSTTPHAIRSGSISHMQSQNLLKMALDKQIDDLKPYFGKKQENVDSWIKKIDKLAEIARMPDEEIFMLAKLKLQGDAEKWWDNKKKEIDSWITLKSKLLDTFGSLGKTNKLELEALLHRRQQNLNEPATKYWNEMMSHCSAYDENMSTQDRVWRIFNGALPEFRHKYENKVFDDVDQLLKALIQNEENRLRTFYEEQEHHGQTSNAAWNQQQFSEAVNQVANNQQRPPWNSRPTNMQQSNSRPDGNNNHQTSKHPN